jgi:hypothetical protein
MACIENIISNASFISSDTFTSLCSPGGGGMNIA